MEAICNSKLLHLQLVVTGTHLSPEFGLTVREIEADGFRIDRRLEMLLSSDSSVGVTKSLGLAVIGFADVLAELKPDLLLLLGDRYEILAAASAAMIARIPIAHLHGGEATEGLIDESIRHAVTKMSHLHFVAAEEYRRRVVQLGELPENVFLVGGMGIDSIQRLSLLDRDTLEASLGFKFLQRNLMITFHPVTLEHDGGKRHMAELLDALAGLEETLLIFTMPNADTDGRVLSHQVEDFVSRHANAHAFESLGQLRYLSCIAQVDGVVGNSSSGLTEVPAFKKGTINIGDRQRGRLQAASVINCEPSRDSIHTAIHELYSPDFQARLSTVRNPYGEGGASEAIVEIIERRISEDLIKKAFYDIRPI